MRFCQRAFSPARLPQFTPQQAWCLNRPSLRLSPGFTRTMSTAMDQKLNALQAYSACDVSTPTADECAF